MATEAQLKEVEILYNAGLPDNKDYTLDRVKKFAHQQSFVSALGRAIELLHANDPVKAFSVLTAVNRVGTATEEELESARDLVDAEIDESQNILGNRLLERGTFGVIIGHSGAGKSFLTVQAGVLMAAGLLY
jgi:RecA-family ATPase